jgi:hypothetical protein
MWEIEHAVESVCTSLNFGSGSSGSPFLVQGMWNLSVSNPHELYKPCQHINSSIHFVFQYPKSLNLRYLPDNFEHYTRRFWRKGQYFWRW